MIAFWRARGVGRGADRACARAAAGGGSAAIVAPLPLGFTRLIDGQHLRDRRPRLAGRHRRGAQPRTCLPARRGGRRPDRGRSGAAADQPQRVAHRDRARRRSARPNGSHRSTKLRALPADLLVLPGHGEPFTGLHARLDAMAASIAERLDALARAARRAAARGRYVSRPCSAARSARTCWAWRPARRSRICAGWR